MKEMAAIALPPGACIRSGFLQTAITVYCEVTMLQQAITSVRAVNLLLARTRHGDCADAKADMDWLGVADVAF